MTSKCIILFITALLLFISGCGGGTNSSTGPQIPSVTPDTGSLEMQMNWPEKEEGLSAQLIPADTVKIEITITGVNISPPVTVYLLKGVNSTTISDIPAGEVQIEFKALDANGKVLAHRITHVKVIAGQSVSVNVILGITLLSTGFVPSSITLNTGDILYFVNNDTVPHTICLTGLSNSGPIPPGGEYSFNCGSKPGKNYTFTSDGFSCYITVTGGIDPTPYSPGIPTPTNTPAPSWKNVGTAAGFSAGSAYYTSLYVSNGTPYVAYSDGANGYKATVMMYNGTSWETVGTAGFSAGEANSTSLYISNGTPYVAYMDGANGGKATVMNFTN